MSARRSSWPAIALVAAVVLAGLGAGANYWGWLDNPTVEGSPRPTFTPPPPVIPDGAAETAALVVPAWQTLAGAAQADWAGADGPRFQLLADTLATHWRVLSGPDPSRRSDPGAAAPGMATTNPDPATGLADARAALAALSTAEWDRAGATTDSAAAWWAGLAGATDQVTAGLTGVYEAPPPLNPLATIGTSDETTAANTLLAAYDEAVYTAASALGRISRGDAFAQLATTLDSLKQGRDNLRRLAADNAWTIQPPAVAYQVPAMSDDASALTAVDRAIRSVAEAAVAWLASTTHTGDALAVVRSLPGLGHGYASAIWFGWPD